MSMPDLSETQAPEGWEPRQYWADMGPWLAGPGAATKEHIATEKRLRSILKSLGPVESVLDVGCGRGRLAALLADVLPKARYSGVDVGMEQAQATLQVRPDGEVFVSALQDFDPGQQWDLVLISEVLMHIPPDEIEQAVSRLFQLSRKWIVAVEWTKRLKGVEDAYWNWIHDYAALFGDRIERSHRSFQQTIYVVRI